jgi:hypothetical protein
VIHQDSHDILLDWPRCFTCHQALSSAYASVADMDLGPHSAERLIQVLRDEAERYIAHGAAS